MSAGMISANMVAGQPFTIEVELKEDDNSPTVLTGYTVAAQLNAEIPHGEMIQRWENNDPAFTKTNGLVKLTINSATTNSYTFKLGFIDILLESSTLPGMRTPKIRIALEQGETK